MDYTIHVNDTPEKEDYMVVIIIDDKHKTEASFAMSRDLKNSGQLKLIKSAITKVKFLNDIKVEELKKKGEKSLKSKLKELDGKLNKKIQKRKK